MQVSVYDFSLVQEYFKFKPTYFWKSLGCAYPENHIFFLKKISKLPQWNPKNCNIALGCKTVNNIWFWYSNFESETGQ